MRLRFLHLLKYVCLFQSHSSSTYGLDDAAGNGLPRAVLDDWEDSGYEGFRAYVVVPAMDNPDGSWPNYIGQLQSVLDDFTETYNVDTENIVLMGNSRGGTGALALAVQMPDYFSKCVACSAFCRKGDIFTIPERFLLE